MTGIRRYDSFAERDGIRLAIRLVVPPGDGPFTFVVFVHGLSSGKDSPRNVVIAENLVDAGIAALLFDLSGNGESSQDPRGEAAWPEDLAAVLRWASSRPDLDARRYGIAGSSLGGVVALEAVHRSLASPAAMVLRAPPIGTRGLDPSRGRTGVPLLAVIGSHDPLLGDILRAAARTPGVQVSIIDGAGHLFEEPGTLEEATRRTVDWFKTALLGAATPAE